MPFPDSGSTAIAASPTRIQSSPTTASLSTGVLVRLEEEQRHDHGRSEGLRARVDAEVAGILEKELARASELLASNRGLVEALVELLLVRKVLDRAELRALTDGGGAHG